jgi:hypothetical protein
MTRTLIKKWFVLFSGFALPLLLAAQNSGGFIITSTDSVVACASTQYSVNSVLRRLFMGNNYRKEWAQQVKLPVFHFSASGFTVKDLGGGMQTKSLHLVDAQGKQWSLRTVDKFITDAALTPALRNKVGRGLSQDLVSAAFPYAAPLAGELARAAGVTAANPQIVFVADDPLLDPYRAVFAGRLCTLEERDPGFDSTETSEALLKNIRSDSRYKVQQDVYLRARLLDILMADWDRHADNRRWGLKDSAGFRLYVAVPRDRDWAFYYSKGWVPWLAQKTGGVRCLVPFTGKLKNVKMQSWKAWTMDEELTNELNAAAWEKSIDSFCAMLTDKAIENAVQHLPASVYKTDGNAFAKKLKSRRDALKKETMKYYRFLAKDAVINGSAGDERFLVSADGENLRVTVYRNGDESQKLYERSFSPKETASLTLTGFGGADVFEIDEKTRSPIRLKIIGGKGRSSYDLKGNVQTTVYGVKEGANVVHAGNAKLRWQNEAGTRPAER